MESFFSHLKGDWPHLISITDPAALDTELARIQREYDTVGRTPRSATSLPMMSIAAAALPSAA